MKSSKIQPQKVEQGLGFTVVSPGFSVVNISKRRLEKLLEMWANVGVYSRSRLDPSALSDASELFKKFPDIYLSWRTYKSDVFLDQRPTPGELAELEEARSALLEAQEALKSQWQEKNRTPNLWGWILAPALREIEARTIAPSTSRQLWGGYRLELIGFAERLREVWDQSDDARRQKLFARLHYWIGKLFIHPQSSCTVEVAWRDGYAFDGPLDDVLLCLGQNLHRLRHCQNPGCDSGRTYFLAERGNTRFCGPECASYGRRVKQLRYWNSKGVKRRAKKQAAARRTRTKPELGNEATHA